MPSVDICCLTQISQIQCGRELRLTSSVQHNLYPRKPPPYSPDLEKHLLQTALTEQDSCALFRCARGHLVVEQYPCLCGQDKWVFQVTTLLRLDSGQLLQLIARYDQ